MSFRQIKPTPALNLALLKIYHWQGDVYENAESALIRAKGLADFLAHAAIYTPQNEPQQQDSLLAVAQSISNEIQAVQIMLAELVKPQPDKGAL